MPAEHKFSDSDLAEFQSAKFCHSMPFLVFVHVVAGSVGLVSATFAMLVTKGSAAHIKYGLVMWHFMVIMATSGIVTACLIENWILLLTGLMTIYLLFTGRSAMTRTAGTVNLEVRVWAVFNLLCFFWALASGLSIMGDESSLKGNYLALAGDSFVFALLDFRLILRGGVTGVDRIIDHLWRFLAATLFGCFALFLFNPQIFPEWFVSMKLNQLPIILIFCVLIYWVVGLKWGNLFKKLL